MSYVAKIDMVTNWLFWFLSITENVGSSSICPAFRLGWVNHLQWLLICLFENGLFALVANGPTYLDIKSCAVITIIYYLVSENQIAVGTEVSFNFEFY